MDTVYVLLEDAYYTTTLGVFRNLADAKEYAQVYAMRNKHGEVTWKELDWGLHGILSENDTVFLDIERSTLY